MSHDNVNGSFDTPGYLVNTAPVIFSATGHKLNVNFNVYGILFLLLYVCQLSDQIPQ